MKTRNTPHSLFAKAAKGESEKKLARKALIKEMTSSKEKAISYLIKAGICDNKGNLSKIYR